MKGATVPRHCLPFVSYNESLEQVGSVGRGCFAGRATKVCVYVSMSVLSQASVLGKGLWRQMCVMFEVKKLNTGVETREPTHVSALHNFMHELHNS